MTPHVHENPARAPVIRNGEDDAAIIRVSLQRSDQFAELFRRHAPAVRRYATRRIGPDAAEDIVAETFLTAFRRRDSYDLSHPDARPWLFGIATRLIGRHRRSEVRLYQALARTGVDPVTESFTEQVDAQVSAHGARRTLAAALARLSAGQRDVLLLVAWGDLTYEQVAEALQIELGTVRSRLSRARAGVQRALGFDPSAVRDEPMSLATRQETTDHE
jgi:RNA polymerase sigma factor (sigma-70 family)